MRRKLDKEGWNTVALVRRPRGDDAAAKWELGDGLPRELGCEGTTLVHAAYDLRVRSRREIWETNVDGTKVLLTSAHSAGVKRILVLSSMSAYRGTRQLYGLAKLDIERATIAAGGVAVRPGLVYGPTARGMAGTLKRMVRLPLVPVIRGHQFPVHEDDFGDAIVKILSNPSWEPEVLSVAQRQPVAFGELLRLFARAQGANPVFVPVPARLMYWTLRIAEAIGGWKWLPVRADSILGLAEPARSIRASSNFPGLLTGLRDIDSPE